MNNIDFDAIDLTKEAPVTEPERQYYYIAKARKYVSEKAQEIGRDLTFCVTTFGCQMNARDSEKLVGVLELIGYKEEPDEEKADFVIYNTPVPSVKMRICVFTDVWDSLVRRRKRIRICSSDSADV